MARFLQLGNQTDRDCSWQVYGIFGGSFYLFHHVHQIRHLTVETVEQPPWEVKFPSVAICSWNNISRQKLDHGKFHVSIKCSDQFNVILVLCTPRCSNISTVRRVSWSESIQLITAPDSQFPEILTANWVTRCTDLVYLAFEVRSRRKSWSNEMLTSFASSLFWTRQMVVKICWWLYGIVRARTADGLCCGFNHLDRAWRPDHQKTDK